MQATSNTTVLCFGELLVRLQSTEASFFTANTGQLKIYPGGSEANVAVTLAKLGIPTRYLSVGPDQMLVQEIKSCLQSYGVDTSAFIHQGDRLGSYYLLSANGLSNGDVIYDRKYSAFSQLKADAINWDELLDTVDWFHFTALTPALNPALAAQCKTALATAHKKGITVSVDLNYRSRLWQYGQEPIEVMPALAQYADVIMGNIWAAHKMLGTSIDDSLNRNTDKASYNAFSKQSAAEIFDKFPQCKHVANTFRFMDSPQHNLFYGCYHSRTADAISESLETHAVIDRIGSGDAFMGGLIYALVQQLSPQQIIDTATKAGFEKLFIAGDFG